MSKFKILNISKKPTISTGQFKSNTNVMALQIWKNPADIFSNCAGFHFKYDQIPLNPEVKKMKLQVCEVSQHQRHRDIIASKIFWETLDKKINLEKPWYQPGNWKLTE